MMLMTGMLISGKMSVAIDSSVNGVASTISIAITMKVYGRLSASRTMDIDRSFPNERPRDHRQAGAAALGCPHRLRPGRDAVGADRAARPASGEVPMRGKAVLDLSGAARRM